jgi:hypothetical protein
VKSKESQDTKNMAGHGFWDRTCPDCAKRYGWQGTIDGDPGCPRCKKLLNENNPRIANDKMLQLKTHARAQDIYDNHRNRLGATELAFIVNMTKKRKYKSTQINSINRMYRKYV